MLMKSQKIKTSGENNEDDLFCSPKDDLFCTPEDKAQDARKRNIDARMAACRKRIRDEVIPEITAKQNGKDGEVTEEPADGQTVGEADAVKEDNSMKTPLTPKISKTAKIFDTKKKEYEEKTPGFEVLVKEEMGKRLIEDSKFEDD